MTVWLAAGGPGHASDVHPGLIALYEAVRAGWVPPDEVSEAEYARAKTLPDSDPFKAFCGFGCSWGAKWFGGYARGRSRSYAGESARSLLRGVPLLSGWTLGVGSFFDREPERLDAFLYCDPPYAGTTGYKVGSGFDHTAFWRRAQEWAAHGTPVYVSELTCPVPHREVLAIEHAAAVRRNGGAPMVDRLFRVLG